MDTRNAFETLIVSDDETNLDQYEVIRSLKKQQEKAKQKKKNKPRQKAKKEDPFKKYSKMVKKEVVLDFTQAGEVETKISKKEQQRIYLEKKKKEKSQKDLSSKENMKSVFEAMNAGSISEKLKQNDRLMFLEYMSSLFDGLRYKHTLTKAEPLCFLKKFRPEINEMLEKFVNSFSRKEGISISKLLLNALFSAQGGVVADNSGKNMSHFILLQLLAKKKPSQYCNALQQLLSLFKFSGKSFSYLNYLIHQVEDPSFRLKLILKVFFDPSQENKNIKELVEHLKFVFSDPKVSKSLEVFGKIPQESYLKVLQFTYCSKLKKDDILRRFFVLVRKNSFLERPNPSFLDSFFPLYDKRILEQEDQSEFFNAILKDSVILMKKHPDECIPKILHAYKKYDVVIEDLVEYLVQDGEYPLARDLVDQIVKQFPSSESKLRPFLKVQSSSTWPIFAVIATTVLIVLICAIVVFLNWSCLCLLQRSFEDAPPEYLQNMKPLLSSLPPEVLDNQYCDQVVIFVRDSLSPWIQKILDLFQK